MANHRLAFGNRALSDRCDAQHGMEQMAVGDRVEAELMNRVEAVFLSVLRAQLQDHAGDVEFAAADGVARAALETDILNFFTAFTAVEEGREQRADTAGVDAAAVYVAADEAEGRTYVEAGCAADAAENILIIGIVHDLAAFRRIEDDDVEALLLLRIVFRIRYDIRRARVEGQVRRQVLGRAVAGQDLEDIADIAHLGDEFFNAEDVHVAGRQGAYHTAVAFVAHGDDRARFGDGGVGAGYAHFSGQEFFTHDAAGRFNFLGNIGNFFFLRIGRKQVGYVFLGVVNGGHYHVGRRVAGDGVDEFAQVRFLRVNACGFKARVEVDFFRCHGFRFDDEFDVLFFCYLQRVVEGFLRRMGAEYDGAVGRSVLFEFVEQFVDVVAGVGFYFVHLFPQGFKVVSFVNAFAVAGIRSRKVFQRFLQRRVVHCALDFLFQQIHFS